MVLRERIDGGENVTEQWIELTLEHYDDQVLKQYIEGKHILGAKLKIIEEEGKPKDRIMILLFEGGTIISARVELTI